MTQSHGSSPPPRRLLQRHEGPRTAGLPTEFEVDLKEMVMLFTYKIPVSVVLLVMLVVFFFATGQLP